MRNPSFLDTLKSIKRNGKLLCPKEFIIISLLNAYIFGKKILKYGCFFVKHGKQKQYDSFLVFLGIYFDMLTLLITFEI